MKFIRITYWSCFLCTGLICNALKIKVKVSLEDWDTIMNSTLLRMQTVANPTKGFWKNAQLKTYSVIIMKYNYPMVLLLTESKTEAFNQFLPVFSLKKFYTYLPSLDMD